MAKTSRQVQGDIYRLLKDSTLYSMISGEVYRGGMRPRDSQLEDAEVYFIAGRPDEIQTGVVSVLIYVPDIDSNGDGVLLEDSDRTEAIERLAQAWVDSLTAEVSCYNFKLDQTISTSDEPEIHQHTVDVRLRYRYYGDDYAPIALPQMAMIDASDTDSDMGYFPLLETEDGADVIITPIIERKLKTENNQST